MKERNFNIKIYSSVGVVVYDEIVKSIDCNTAIKMVLDNIATICCGDKIEIDEVEV